MTFKAGDRVSTGYSFAKEPIVGTVVRVEGKLRIRVESGAKAGELTYPDSPPWLLGIGPLEAACAECGRRFRYQHGEENFFCPRCEAEAAPPPYVPPADRPTAPAVTSRDDIGVHLAGEPSQCNGVVTQYCTRCGAILKRVKAGSKVFAVGSLIERGHGWQAILIASDGKETCHARQQKATA